MSESKQENEQEYKEEQDNAEELDRILKDMNSFEFCKTNILDEVKFMSKNDKEIFNALPLTNSQKEELLLSVYKIEKTIQEE
jgi:hypothetical protein